MAVYIRLLMLVAALLVVMVNADAQSGAEDRQITNTAPLDWMGKPPNVAVNGQSFFDLIFLNEGPFELGLSQTQTQARFSQVITGCTFTNVRPAAYNNPIPFIGGGQQKLFFHTTASCTDGREIAVLTENFIMGINLTDPNEREVRWIGQFCVSHPLESSVTSCTASQSRQSCVTAPKPSGFSCTADIGETWRQTRFMREASSERRCEKVWNACANPVNRPAGSAFSPCYGAGGAFEVVCSGGAENARLQSPSVKIDLPEYVARRWETRKSACDDADADGLVTLPSGNLLSCRLIDQQRDERLAREAAQAAAREQELAEFRARQAAREAEEVQREEARRRAAEEEYQRLLTTPREQLLREAGFAQFALRTYLPQTVTVRGVGEITLALAEMSSVTENSALEGYYTLSAGADWDEGSDICTLTVRKVNGAPDMATAIENAQEECQLDGLSLSGEGAFVIGTVQHGDQTYQVELTPAPGNGESMLLPLPDSWEQITAAAQVAPG